MDDFQSPHRGPRGRPISAIVLHYSGSLELETTARWMCTAESRYSVHYLVGRAGHVLQLVPDAEVAWHAGRSAMHPRAANDEKEPHVDEFSIGIELIGTADSGFTDRQLASVFSLVERLIHAHRIRPDRIVGHEHVAPGRKIDPSGFDQQFPWRVLREVADVAYQALERRRLKPGGA